MPQRSVWQTPVKGEEEHVITVLDFGVVQRQEKEEEESSSLTNAKTKEKEEEYDEESSSSRYKQHKYRNIILLVDDEPDICLIYQIVLNGAGYKCDSYTDPVKAI
jgi:PleD family two-component response regulator